MRGGADDLRSGGIISPRGSMPSGGMGGGIEPIAGTGETRGAGSDGRIVHGYHPHGRRQSRKRSPG